MAMYQVLLICNTSGRFEIIPLMNKLEVQRTHLTEIAV